MKYPDTNLIGGVNHLKGIFYDNFTDELVVWSGRRTVARFRMDSRDLVALSAKLANLSLQLEDYRSALRIRKFADEEQSQ